MWFSIITYQEGIPIPPFAVTGITGLHRCLMNMSTSTRQEAYAFGRTHFTWLNAGSLPNISATGRHPAPESPKPCTNITVAVCLAVAFTTKGADIVAVLVDLPRLSEPADI